MDPIKESFSRVKEDIDALRAEVEEMRISLIDLCRILEQLTKKDNEKAQKESPPENSQPPANQQIIPTHSSLNQTNQQIIPTHSLDINTEIAEKQLFSTGNRGVPTDRQTNQQTDRHTESSIENAAEMLKSLDNIKREIRKKFKKLTEQEWLVFSTIYQLDEEAGYSDYKILAERLKLTESSIRDYVGKLINKGIPVDKTKQNNKNIRLNISPNLKQIASLPTIITLRDL